MRGTLVVLEALTLLLLITVPVGAAPSLQKGAQTSYNLSASISFLQSCEALGVSTSANTIVCPMIATIPSTLDINGTLDWTVIDLNNTTASLIVTRDLTISSDTGVSPAAHSPRSFNESINLATRIVTLLPLIMPEIDQVLQMAQTSMTSNLPAGANWSSSMSAFDSTMVSRPPYTMWWVNGPLKLNQTIPVLVFPTNVTRTSGVDLGGLLGTRAAWTLVFSLSRPLILPDPSATSPSTIPFANNLVLSFDFNYDKTSDLLLSASANIQIGFGEETTIQPVLCDSSISSVSCPVSSSPTTFMREFGISIQSSLKLVSTTLDLSKPMIQSTSSQDGNSGSQSSAGSETGSGSGIATGTGGGSSSGTSGTTSGTRQPTSNQGQPKSPLESTSWPGWVYGVLGIVAAAIVGSGVWIARRWFTKTSTKASTVQPSN